MRSLGFAALAGALVGTAAAQKPAVRIVAPVDNTRMTLPESRPALANPANDAGRVPATTQLTGLSIAFSRTPAQQQALDALIAAQQDPASAQYHQWLTPDQFGAEFGAADSDIAQVQAWLETQGFTVTGVTRNRTEIQFSGTVAQVEAAFGTEMHYFKTAGGQHFAPSTDLSIPVAFGNAVVAVRHLTDTKPHSHLRPTAKFTSSQSGSHFMTPGDVSTIYDINAAYNAGYTGYGQTIVVVGQSSVLGTDITNFQTASGVPVRLPNFTLIPNTGTAAISSGDESESDLDLEYTSSIAKGATINFVYTGNATNSGGAFGALEYAINNKLGTIISSSYGDCELDLGTTYFPIYNAYIQQAVAQGQTVISAAGDQGSVDCYGDTYLTNAQQAAVAVDWPASSQYALGLGGTEFPSADTALGNTTYWAAQGTSDVIASATGYIPEMVWNDNSASQLSSGGGGTSVYAPRPTWQAGTFGGVAIPTGTGRLVPDISLDASNTDAPYIYCSSDYSATGITGSCSNGFRDVNATNLTLAGGTSFAAPIFAGMLALINQARASTGSGLVNPTLYTLASNSSTYASAFHDITSGNNACTTGTTYPIAYTSSGAVSAYGPACAAGGLYSTATGFDEATGLGSVDLNNLLTAWPGTVAAAPPAFSMSSSAVSVAQGSSVTATITLTPLRGYKGTVNLTLNANPAILYGCYSINNATISGTTAVTATATIYTYATTTACPSGATALLTSGGKLAAAQAPAKPGQPEPSRLPAGIAMAGLLAMGFLGRRSKRVRGLVLMALLAVAGFGLSGCGSGGSGTGVVGTTTTAVTPGKGTFAVVVTGIDSVSGETASTSFNVTIQ